MKRVGSTVNPRKLLDRTGLLLDKKGSHPDPSNYRKGPSRSLIPSDVKSRFKKVEITQKVSKRETGRHGPGSFFLPLPDSGGRGVGVPGPTSSHVGG